MRCAFEDKILPREATIREKISNPVLIPKHNKESSAVNSVLQLEHFNQCSGSPSDATELTIDLIPVNSRLWPEGSSCPSKFRTRYLSTLGIWTEDRAKVLSERSSEVAVSRCKLSFGKLKPQQESTAEELLSPQDPSLEALLLRAKSLPIAVPKPTKKAGEIKVDCSTEETESMASSLDTVGSAESSSSRVSLENIDQYLLPARPRRRDVRRKYLSKVGIEDLPSPAQRSGSFALTATGLDIRYEKLKDHQYQDLTFDDLVKVLGGLVGVSMPKSPSLKPPTPCQTCRRSAPSSWNSKLNEPLSCPHKRVHFSETVSTVYIPVHYDYSNRIRASYWSSAAEIREMVYRNMLEFDAEGYKWDNVVEEEDMYYNEDTNDYIHPAFYDMLLQDSNEENAGDGEGMVSEGRRLPRMEKNQGIWA